jgi:hypothetical protein
MWHTLQDLNIENNDFMLELKDESLKEFDISMLQTDDKIMKIKYFDKVREECKNNIWFFFREVVRIYSPVSLYSKATNMENGRFILNLDNMAMIYLYSKNKSFIFPSSGEKNWFDSNYDTMKNIPMKLGTTSTLMLLTLYEKFITNNEREGLSHVYWISDDYSSISERVGDTLIERGNQIIQSNYHLYQSIEPYNIRLFPANPCKCYINESGPSRFRFYTGKTKSGLLPEIIDYMNSHGELQLYTVLEDTYNEPCRLNLLEYLRKPSFPEFIDINSLEDFIRNTCTHRISNISLIYDDTSIKDENRIFTYLV